MYPGTRACQTTTFTFTSISPQKKKKRSDRQSKAMSEIYGAAKLVSAGVLGAVSQKFERVTAA